MEVTNNPSASRYELALEGGVAVADYRRHDDRLVITHVGVPPALQNKGIATSLMRGVVEDAKAKGLTIVPVCPFAVAYLKKHPQ